MPAQSPDSGPSQSEALRKSPSPPKAPEKQAVEGQCVEITEVTVIRDLRVLKNWLSVKASRKFKDIEVEVVSANGKTKIVVATVVVLAVVGFIIGLLI